MHSRKVRIELEDFFVFFGARIEIPLYYVQNSNVDADDWRKRIELLRAFDFCHGFIRSPYREKVDTVPMMRRRIIRVEFDPAFVLFFSLAELPRIPIDVPQGGVCLCQRVVNLESALRRSPGFRQRLARWREIGRASCRERV